MPQLAINVANISFVTNHDKLSEVTFCFKLKYFYQLLGDLVGLHLKFAYLILHLYIAISIPNVDVQIYDTGIP